MQKSIFKTKQRTANELSFFFQAEDGIRGRNGTGVQTCALPILQPGRGSAAAALSRRDVIELGIAATLAARSEERRVGKECRCRWWRDHEKKKSLSGRRSLRRDRKADPLPHPELGRAVD